MQEQFFYAIFQFCKFFINLVIIGAKYMQICAGPCESAQKNMRIRAGSCKSVQKICRFVQGHANPCENVRNRSKMQSQAVFRDVRKRAKNVDFYTKSDKIVPFETVKN